MSISGPLVSSGPVAIAEEEEVEAASTIPESHRRHLYGRGDLDRLVHDFFLMGSRAPQNAGHLSASTWTEALGHDLAGGRDVLRVPVARSAGRYMTLFRRRPLAIDEVVARYLESTVESYLCHFPDEPTLARRYGVPLLYGRLDTIFGKKVQIAEIDDQASFPSLLKHLNPIADSWFIGLEKMLEADGAPLRLVEQVDPLEGTARGYHHTDGNWLPRLMPWDDPEQFSVVARSRRWVPGFDAFNDSWEQRNILSGRHRDYKGVLAPIGLALLVSDIDVAIDAARLILRRLKTQNDMSRDHQAVIIKGVQSARCEQVWAVALGDRGRGMDGLEKVRAKVRALEASSGEPIHLLIQGYERPTTAAELGLFDDDDSDDVGMLPVLNAPALDAPVLNPPVLNGPVLDAPVLDPKRLHVLARIFFVCLPDIQGVMRPTVVGGIAQARTTPTRIHGANDAATFGLIRPGLGLCPLSTPDDVLRYRAGSRTAMDPIQRRAYDEWNRLPAVVRPRFVSAAG